MDNSIPISKSLLVSAMLMAVSSWVSAAPTNEQLYEEINQLKAQVAQAAEWKNPNTVVHLGGYASAGYSKTDATGDDGTFNVGSFSPIFHFQYRDIVMMESELEIELDDDGATEVKMEYMTIDWFMNDHAVLVAGAFLSPIGQFRQNLHPAWINKMPSAPPGFGHDGAAPVSDLGIQLRGGFHMGSMKANYAVYTGNGPEIKAEVEDDGAGSVDAIEYDGVEAEAFGADRDGEKVVGGRFGFLPYPKLEIGVSFLSGKATVTEYEDLDLALFGVTPPPDLDTTPVAASDYDVTGFDLSYNYDGLDVRYEYVKTELGANTLGAYDLEIAEWTTWYAQAAYVFMSRYELVLRYTDFDSAHASADMQQTAVGLNYLFSNNFVGKLAVESNDNPNAGLTADDRWLLQLAYGF